MATKQALLIQYNSYKKDIKGLPDSSPLRVKIKAQMSDILKRLAELERDDPTALSKKFGLTPKQHRRGLYEIIERIVGRKLTDPENAELKESMIKYVEEHGQKAAPSPAVKYIFTCNKCRQDVQGGSGKAFRQKMERKYPDAKRLPDVPAIKCDDDF